MCDLRWSLIQDVPSPEAHTEPTLAEFEEMILRDPALEAEAFFVASTGSGAFIGMSNLWRNDPSGKRLDAGMTGVVRANRRRGIATALKVRTIQYAQTVGAEDDCDQQRGEQSDVHTEPQAGIRAYAGVDQLPKIGNRVIRVA